LGGQIPSDPFLEACSRVRQLAHAKGGVPQRVTSNNVELGVLLLVCKTTESLDHVVRLAERPSCDIESPKTEQRRGEFGNISEPLAQR